MSSPSAHHINAAHQSTTLDCLAFSKPSRMSTMQDLSQCSKAFAPIPRSDQKCSLQGTVASSGTNLTNKKPAAPINKKRKDGLSDLMFSVLKPVVIPQPTTASCHDFFDPSKILENDKKIEQEICQPAITISKLFSELHQISRRDSENSLHDDDLCSESSCALDDEEMVESNLENLGSVYDLSPSPFRQSNSAGSFFSFSSHSLATIAQVTPTSPAKHPSEDQILEDLSESTAQAARPLHEALEIACESTEPVAAVQDSDELLVAQSED